MSARSPARLKPMGRVGPAALRTRSRADFVYESLLDGIWEGRFAHGERLREEEIGTALGVSRTPVREALQRLQQRGLLTFGLGRGLVVAQLSKSQVLELYAMREILEGSAARFAAQHAHSTEIDLLYILQADLAKAGSDDPITLTKLNRRFHQAICEAAHNKYLLQALDSLNDSLALLHSNTFRIPTRRIETDAEHRSIVEAIHRRDPDEAEANARNHIRQAQRTRFEASHDDECGRPTSAVYLPGNVGC
jgi:DNA-binding GntR family transcriptional regulator